MPLLVALACSLGCRCDRLKDEVDGQPFTRCAQVDPPAERIVRAGSLVLLIKARELQVIEPQGARIVAFTGPVGAALAPSDLALLEAARPGLALYLGGLGDDVDVAVRNLRALASMRIPTLFLAGGADRWPVIEAAFAALGEGERDYVLQASGLRTVRLGNEHLVLVPGAPLGRYAIDEHGCGFSTSDLEEIEAAARAVPAAPTWLVSWAAPAGVARGFGGTELGSPELRALASKLGIEGGLFAYPESAPASEDARFLAVPRLAAVGSLRADGSRLPAAVITFVLEPRGPVRAP